MEESIDNIKCCNTCIYKETTNSGSVCILGNTFLLCDLNKETNCPFYETKGDD